MEKIFETAARQKYRYPYKGLIATEDLWDLTPAQLDGVYKTLNKTAKVQGEDSLMDNRSVSEELQNQIEIVKYIFSVKREEERARKVETENREKRKHIMEIIAEKQDASLRKMSEEDLVKMLDDLG